VFPSSKRSKKNSRCWTRKKKSLRLRKNVWIKKQGPKKPKRQPLTSRSKVSTFSATYSA